MDRLPAELKKDSNVRRVIAQSPATVDTAQQLQQYETVSHSGVDLMIAFVLQPQPFARAIADAANRGIPTISAANPVPTADAVSVDGNKYLGAAETASYISRLQSGKGNWLYVKGIAGSAVDLLSVSAWDSVASHCPGVKVIKDQVYGGLSDSIAKGAMLRYLATHPQPLDAVMQTAYMGTGIMSAFQQSGRAMPVVEDSGLTKGTLGYWWHNRPKYHGVGTSVPAGPFSPAVAEVALRMLHGQGVKLNALVGVDPVVTDANLDKWAEPSWTLTTPGGAPGPRDSFMTSSYINAFFSHPAPLK